MKSDVYVQNVMTEMTPAETVRLICPVTKTSQTESARPKQLRPKSLVPVQKTLVMFYDTNVSDICIVCYG